MAEKIVNRRSDIFANVAQTKRWIKCLEAWAKANDKTVTEVATLLGYSRRKSWFDLRTGVAKRVRLDTLNASITTCGLDANFINGVYDFRSQFTEARNIFSDFGDKYAAYMKAGNIYFAGQIIRKAVMFVYETLVPKDLIINLYMHNRRNEFESAVINVTADEFNCYIIKIFGGPVCVRFMLLKNVNNKEMPVMEGDLDIHAISAIKRLLSHKRKVAVQKKEDREKFMKNSAKLSSTMYK